MIDERKEEAAALYALDLLEGAERAAFEAELAREPALRTLVDQLRETSSQLAFTAPPAQPSAALRARVLASIGGQNPAAASARTVAGASDERVVPFRLPAWLGWGLAACFALGTVYFSTRYVGTRAELATASTQAALAEIELRSTRQQLEAERILTARQIADLRKAGDLAELRIARLTTQLEKAEAAIAVWNPATQRGVLDVSKLPALASDQDYQLWVIDPRYPNPVNGGVFTVNESGTASFAFRPDQPVSDAKAFAISRERKGGVPKAEGPILAVGAF